MTSHYLRFDETKGKWFVTWNGRVSEWDTLEGAEWYLNIRQGEPVRCRNRQRKDDVLINIFSRVSYDTKEIN